MTNQGNPMHFVCTQAEARDLIEENQSYWVSNCECREAKGGCKRSRIDVCLSFTDAEDGNSKHEVDFYHVVELLLEAENKKLVIRPYRSENREKVEGICFCCDDCCDYFMNAEEKCDPGDMIEQTDGQWCTACGDCVDICYFGARQIKDNELVLDEDKCYGCGLCVEVCPNNAIRMSPR